MAIPSWIVGQVLASADVDTWFVPRAAVTTGDQSVTSSTALANDVTLVLPVDAGATYDVTFHGVFDGLLAAGLDIEFTVPAGANLYLSAPQFGNGSPSNAVMNAGTRYNNVLALNGAGNSVGLYATGTLVIGGTAGNLQFQFSQDSSNGTATRRRAGSRLVLRRIA